ncbi:unnamed protein product, partial [Ixodes pacificus]
QDKAVLGRCSHRSRKKYPRAPDTTANGGRGTGGRSSSERRHPRVFVPVAKENETPLGDCGRRSSGSWHEDSTPSLDRGRTLGGSACAVPRLRRSGWRRRLRTPFRSEPVCLAPRQRPK